MLLSVKQVMKQIKKQTLVHPVSFESKSGDLIGLIGENGAGKSTLIKMIATVLKPTSGDICLDEQSIIKKPEKMRAGLGYLPQNFPVYDHLTIEEFLLFMASIKEVDPQLAIQQIQEYLTQFHLIQSRNSRLMDLSGGMLQKVGIINSLLGNPDVILLDEPANGLDPVERNHLRNLLVTLAKEKIILYSTHIIADVEQVATRIMMMDKGSMIYDGTDHAVKETVKGSVWEFQVKDEKETGDYFIISQKAVDGKMKLRVVSKVKPHQNAALVEETLEDAYLYMVSKRGIAS